MEIGKLSLVREEIGVADRKLCTNSLSHTEYIGELHHTPSEEVESDKSYFSSIICERNNLKYFHSREKVH